jgi:hypothetical protein
MKICWHSMNNLCLFALDSNMVLPYVLISRDGKRKRNLRKQANISKILLTYYTKMYICFITCFISTFRRAIYCKIFMITKSLITPVNFGRIPPTVWALKAGQDFSIYSFDSHFVKQRGTCWPYAQPGMVLIPPVKFHWNPTSSLTC